MKKARKVREVRSQKVRVEIVQPQTAMVPVSSPVVPAQETVEAALEVARNAVYYHDQLLKIIAKMVPEREIYAYVVGKKCNRCAGMLKHNDYCPNCRSKQMGTEILEPYFSAVGCRLALKLVGAKWQETEMLQDRYEGKEGPYIIFQLWVTVTPRRGEPVRTMGSRSTADDFFSRRYRWENGKRIPYRLPLEEVNIRNVQLGAISHAFNRGLKDIGFMPTAQHLIDAGVKLSNLKRIQFGRGGDEEEFAGASSPPSGSPQGGGGAGQKDPVPPSSGPAAPPAESRPPAESKPQAEQEKPAPGPPKALIPMKITSVKWTTNSKGLAVTIDNGAVYYCFDNKKMGEPINGKSNKLFDILLNGQGKIGMLLTKKDKPKNSDREFTNIVGLLRLGDDEWLEDGTPILRREPATREPGEDSEEELYER